MNKLVCSLLTIVLAFAFASCEKEIINNGGKEKQGKSKFKNYFVSNKRGNNNV